MAALVADKEAEIATLAAQLAAQASINNAGERARKETEGESSGKQLTHQDINAIFAEKIREFQMSLTTPILGYKKPYPTYYDTLDPLLVQQFVQSLKGSAFTWYT
ncbi:hypothetical protein ACFX2F_023005 [Malus domestica]